MEAARTDNTRGSQMMLIQWNLHLVEPLSDKNCSPKYITYSFVFQFHVGQQNVAILLSCLLRLEQVLL